MFYPLLNQKINIQISFFQPPKFLNPTYPNLIATCSRDARMIFDRSIFKANVSISLKKVTLFFVQVLDEFWKLNQKLTVPWWFIKISTHLYSIMNECVHLGYKEALEVIIIHHQCPLKFHNPTFEVTTCHLYQVCSKCDNMYEWRLWK